MLSITREFRFEAAHHLALPHLSSQENEKIFGPCSKNHGHSYRIRITLCGTPNEYGWLLDFSQMKKIVQVHLLSDYDHADLNTLEDFSGIPPTAENMARAIFLRLKPHFESETSRLCKVSVFETPDAWASWEENHAQSS